MRLAVLSFARLAIGRRVAGRNRLRGWSLAAAALLLVPAALHSQDLERRVLEIDGVDPETEAIQLDNVGASAAVVELVSFNGNRVFHRMQDVRDEIDTAEAGGPLATRIFRFVTDNSEHAYPLTKRFGWLLAPPRFFNSSGLGFCGQAADLIQLLSSDRGIPARVWILGGHVVGHCGDKWAVPVPSSAFPNITDTWKTLEDFMRFCNIGNPPLIERGLFS